MATAVYQRVLSKRHGDKSNLVKASPHNPHNPQIDVSPQLDRARQLNRLLLRKLDFLAPLDGPIGSRKHETMTAQDMSVSMRKTLNELEDIAEKLNPDMPEGYDDPEDEYACDCVAFWRLQVHRIEKAIPTGF